MHSANDPGASAQQAGLGTGLHLEHACARLQDAAVELETVLATLPGDEQADLHEAIGSIMETLQLIASAHARLEPPIAAD
ncbi:hypothetical protein VH569_07315 [Azospirillum sp. 11R-A]|uniref:hypothetical protein n=1 Tax=Azospirillum TaxID=191 RepID=UPI001FE8C317|nr:hypothetical protein [Azospirillum melinis]MBP2308032.1 hypothetical protein [Azospirillum melinis]